MSLVVGVGLIARSRGGGGYISKALSELTSYRAADHPGQVVIVSDGSEKPITWAYSKNNTWISVYSAAVLSTDPAQSWDGTPKNFQLVELGDSFIFMGSGAAGYEYYGIVTAAQRLSGQRLRRSLTRNFGKGGDGSTDALVRLPDALATGAGVLIVHLSTNDGTSTTVDGTLAALKKIRDDAAAQHTATIFVAPEPRGNDTYPSQRLAGTALQYHLARRTRMLAELPQPGCVVVDVRDLLLKPGTENDVLDGFTIDGLHMSTVGADEVWGPRIAAAIMTLAPPATDLPSGTTARSKNVNVECAGASTSSDTSTTPPTGYTGTNAGGLTGVLRYYREVTTATGRWCRSRVSGAVPTADAAVDLLRQITLQGNLEEGKTYEVVCEYEIEAGAQNVQSLQLGFQAAGSSTTQLWDSDKYQTPFVISGKAQKGWFRTPPFTATNVVGLTDFRIRLAAYLSKLGAPVLEVRTRNFELKEVAA